MILLKLCSSRYWLNHALYFILFFFFPFTSIGLGRNDKMFRLQKKKELGNNNATRKTKNITTAKLDRF